MLAPCTAGGFFNGILFLATRAALIITFVPSLFLVCPPSIPEGKKYRRQRELSYEDKSHYEKIVVALGETIRLMKQIDEIIDAHGGWPF